MINWKVRIKNKLFWMAIIPAILFLVQSVLALFGVQFDFTDIQEKLLTIVEAVFAILVIIGVVTDMTTSGVGDSERAMTYEKPYKD